MDSIGNSLYLGASAMYAFSQGIAVTANNVANVSTTGFVPGRAEYAENANAQGVRFTTVLKDAGVPVGPDTDPAADNAEVYDVTSDLALEALPPSGTELSDEISRMISTQHAYEANAQIIHTTDTMLGTFLDIKA